MEGQPSGSYDEELIQRGIEYAREHDEEISDKVAARIASQLHGGQASALYSFASSGAIDSERLRDEYLETYNDPHTPELVKEWVSFLGTHLVHAEGKDEEGNRPPVEGWYDRVKDDAPDVGHVALSREVEPEDTPRVWIADLAAYNNGILHGKWTRADDGVEVLQDAVADVLATSPIAGAEEFAIHDYDNFEGLERELGEYARLETVAEVGAGIAEHGLPFAVLCTVLGMERAAEAREHFTDFYRGRYDSLIDYAEHLWDELGYQQIIDDSLPPEVAAFVQADYQSFAEASTVDSYVVELDSGEVLIFDTNL